MSRYFSLILADILLVLALAFEKLGEELYNALNDTWLEVEEKASELDLERHLGVHFAAAG